jgi:DNA-binding GntR family transcriptional regulator
LKTNNNSPILSYSTISDIVYKWIREGIINSEFKPGEWITQEMVTERLNVSRTPVRDAIKRLQSEGLLIVKPHKGAMVVQLSMEKLIEIYEIRMLLEGAAAKHAGKNITDKDIRELEKLNAKMISQRDDLQKFMVCNRAFHHTLYCFSKREYLINSIFALWDLIEPYRLRYFSLKGKIDEAIKEHVKVISFLRNHQPEEVREAIVKHLNDVVTTLTNNPIEQTSEKSKRSTMHH